MLLEGAGGRADGGGIPSARRRGVGTFGHADPATQGCDKAIAVADPSSIVGRCGCDQRAQDAALRGRCPAGCLGDRFLHRLEEPRAPHLGGLRRHLGTECVRNLAIVCAGPSSERWQSRLFYVHADSYLALVSFSPQAGDVGFDPLGISDLIDVRWLREAELKHGRVCMLAATGMIVQDVATFPGVTTTFGEAPEIQRCLCQTVSIYLSREIVGVFGVIDQL